jgi:hypothetical protein
MGYDWLQNNVQLGQVQLAKINTTWQSEVCQAHKGKMKCALLMGDHEVCQQSRPVVGKRLAFCFGREGSDGGVLVGRLC